MFDLRSQNIIAKSKNEFPDRSISLRTTKFVSNGSVAEGSAQRIYKWGVCKIKTAAPNSHASVKTSRCSSRVALHLPLPPRGGAGPVGIVPGLQKNSEAFAVAHVWPSPSVHL
jgi:hypothetical protein